MRGSPTNEGDGDPMGDWEMLAKSEAALKQSPHRALAYDLRSVMEAGALRGKSGPQAPIGGPG